MYGVFDAKMFTQLGYSSRIMTFLLILKFLWSLKIHYFATLKNGQSIDKNILTLFFHVIPYILGYGATHKTESHILNLFLLKYPDFMMARQTPNLTKLNPLACVRYKDLLHIYFLYKLQCQKRLDNNKQTTQPKHINHQLKNETLRLRKLMKFRSVLINNMFR